MSDFLQPAFTTGEISPGLYARVDVARYQSALKLCRNFIVRPSGGIDNRPGLRFVCEVKDSTQRVRLIPFQVSDTVNYVLVFGDYTLRFIVDGGELTAEGAQTYAAGTTYETDEYVTYSSLTYRALRQTVGDQPDISPLDWVAATIYEITSPYAVADLPSVKYTQSVDVMTLTHSAYVTKELRRYGPTDWSFADFDAEGGPFDDLNIDKSIRIYSSDDLGAVTITANTDLFFSTDVGRLIRIESSLNESDKAWEPGKSASLIPGVIRRVDERVYEITVGGTTGTVRPTHTSGARPDGDPGVTWLYLHSGVGVVEITGYTSATVVSARVVSRLPGSVVGGLGTLANTTNAVGDGTTRTFAIPLASSEDDYLYVVTLDGVEQEAYIDFTVDAAANTMSFTDAPANGVVIVVKEYDSNKRTYNFSMGAWGEVDGYPRAVGYFADRLVLGGSVGLPETIWMSKTSDYTNFGTSTPIVADDSITEGLNGRKRNEIRDIVPLSKLVVLTSSGEWVASGGQDNLISPETISFNQQSHYGSADIQAKIVGNSALYIQSGGKIVRDLGYVFESDSYSGGDLILMSNHLTRYNTITAMDFHTLPYSTMWAVRDDGLLLSMAYMKAQDVIGWARHDTDGLFEDVCVIREGSEETAYFVVNRTIGGVTNRYIEYLTVRYQEDVRDSFFVDSGLTYDGRNTGSKTMTLSGGSTWLAGETLTLTASASTFVSGDVGDEIHYSETSTLKLRITAYTSATVVSVTPDRTVVAEYRTLPITTWGMARDVFSGLDHLEGETVAMLADGNVVSNGRDDPVYSVSSGDVTLPYHAVVVHVGLPYYSDMKTLDITVIGSPQGSATVRAKPKAVPRVAVMVENSRSVKVGPDEDHLYEDRPRQFEGYDDPASLVTGLIEVNTTTTWGLGGSIMIRQDNPLPLSIVGVIPEVEVGGR